MKRRIKKRNRLQRMAAKGFRGYPVATVAFYGPTNRRASKVVVAIVPDDSDCEPIALERWYSDITDVRQDEVIRTEIIEFIQRYNIKSVVATDRIIGCPHEEIKDYPEGESCPHCPFWVNRDRFTHEIIN
jgi:hypothetical protein